MKAQTAYSEWVLGSVEELTGYLVDCHQRLFSESVLCPGEGKTKGKCQIREHTLWIVIQELYGISVYEFSPSHPPHTCKLIIITIDHCSTAGLRGSLSRLQLDYVDIVFANRNDVNSPMEGQSPTFEMMILTVC